MRDFTAAERRLASVVTMPPLKPTPLIEQLFVEMALRIGRPWHREDFKLIGQDAYIEVSDAEKRAAFADMCAGRAEIHALEYWWEQYCLWYARNEKDLTAPP